MAEAKVSQAGAKVTVACKLPHGLELRLFKFHEVNQPLPGGGYKTVKESRVDDAAGSVVIKGNAVAVGKAPAHRIVKRGGSPFTDGFALTSNVPKEFWEKWLEQNASHPAVTSGLILAYDKPEMAVGAAKERAPAVRSGLEPLAQGKDPRAPSKVKKAIVKDDEEDEAA